MKRVIVAAAFASVLALTGSAGAQSFPNHPVTMVIPVRRRRTAGHHRPHHRAAHGRTARPDGGDREYRRRRRHDRLQARRRCQARRLHDDSRQRRHPCAEPDALQASALQRGDRFHAGGLSRSDADRDHRAAGPAGKQLQGIHRLRQGQSGQDAIRLGRRRLRHASRPASCSTARWERKSCTCPTRAPARPCRT